MDKLTDKTKALRLAIRDLKIIQRAYVARADASRYGIKFGLLAKQHYDEHQEAIDILQEMLKNESET